LKGFASPPRTDPIDPEAPERLTSPDSRPDARTSTSANPVTGESDTLTRRQLRAQRAAEEAAAAQQPAAVEQPAVEQPTVEPAPAAEPTPSRPLTRRELREAALRAEADSAERRRRERELREEEIASLEIAPLDSGVLEPDVELHLEPADTDPARDPLAPPAPLHLAPATDLAVAAVIQPGLRPRDRRPSDRTPKPQSQPQPQLSRVHAELAADPRRASAPARSARASHFASPTLSKRATWAKAGLSAVAMAFVLGITAVTALPTTVSASPIDANVVNLSLSAAANDDTQQLITSDAASAATIDRDGYGVADVGELQAAGYSTAQLLVGRSLAQELVDAMDAGKLVGSQPDHMKEIRWIAQGVTVADCGVDYRVLEIIAIAVRNFDQVGVSDINRKCTGQIEGAGTSSSHYVDGGGHAVDFYLLDNKSLNGSDAGTLKLISLLDPVMPVGARVGQASCRASAGVKLQLTNWTEFDDSCTHMHVDVPVTDAPLLLNDDTALTTSR
jgi:hypothetical protein